MNSAPPREIIKWLQTLQLSFALKNYKRDFANGYLIAEILSKYYPLDVQMHSYDIGTGSSAKKNNWGLLERLFNKYSFPITRELLTKVASMHMKATNILLSLIYNQLSSKGSQNDAVIVTGYERHQDVNIFIDNEPFINPNPYSNPKNNIPSSFPPAGGSLISINQAPLNIPSHMQTSHLQESDSRSSATLHMTRTFFLVAMPNPGPQINFYRSVYQPAYAREILAEAYAPQGKPFPPLPDLERRHAEIRPALVEWARARNQSDIKAFLDTFLPLLVTAPKHGPLFWIVQSSVCLFGNVLWESNVGGALSGSCEEVFNRLWLHREYKPLIRTLGTANEKTVDIAEIIRAFLGDSVDLIDDGMAVKVFRDLKRLGGDTEQSDYLFLFAAFNFCQTNENPKTLKTTHSSKSQLTVLYLSECLTVINSFKMPKKRQILLNQNPNIAEQRKEEWHIAAVFHILASIIHMGIPLTLDILRDVTTAALHVFFKIVVHPDSPAVLSKAYVSMLVELYCQKDTLGIRNDVHTCLLLVLRRFKGVLLRDVLCLISPILMIQPSLCTSFTIALLSLGEVEATRALTEPNIVTWGLPFLNNPAHLEISKTWNAFGVIMGIVKISLVERRCLTNATINLVHTAFASDPNMPQTPHDLIFTKLADYLLSALCVEESSQAAWDLFMYFMVHCSTMLLLKRFPALLSCLIYSHTLEKTKVKRRLLGRLRKLTAIETLESLKADKSDRYYVLSTLTQQVLEMYQREAERVLQIFRLEFPCFATQKQYHILEMI